MEENKTAEARRVYQDLCEYLDAIGWKYDKVEKSFILRFGVKRGSVTMQCMWYVDESSRVLRLYATTNFKFSKDKLVEGALATSHANYRTANGVFEYDISTGAVTFKLIQAYRGSVLSPTIFDYMLDTTVGMVDDYTALFLMLSNGMIDMPTFVKKVDEL